MRDQIFHLAFPSHSLAKTKIFFKALGCKFGRESDHALVINLGGNQLVAQRIKEIPNPQKGIYPRHFGLIFRSRNEWQTILNHAKRNKLKFYQPPKIRYEGQALEHRTFFLEDPSRNLMEFKHYSQPQAIFGKKQYRKVGETKRSTKFP